MSSDAELDDQGSAREGGAKASHGAPQSSGNQVSGAATLEGVSQDDGAASQRLKLLLDEVVGGLNESYTRYGAVLDDLRSRLHDLSHQAAETGEVGTLSRPAGGDATVNAGEADLQARFDRLTANLESTLDASSPAVLGETVASLPVGMEAQIQTADMAPDLQVLRALADRLEGMEGSLMRAEAHAARVEALENQLLELIELIGNSGSQIEQAAQRAAAETAKRLEDERRASGAAERLDAIQQELQDLNQRASRMDERTSGALDAIGERLQSLAKRYRPGDRSDALLRPAAIGPKNGTGKGNGNGNGSGYHRSFRMESAGEPIIVGNGAGQTGADNDRAGPENGKDGQGEADDCPPEPRPYWGKPKPETRAPMSVETLAGPAEDAPPSEPSNDNDAVEIKAAQPQPEISSDGESSELSRLEILQASLHQVFDNIPDDDDRFEMILTRDKPARLRIDKFTHVAMNPDARIYRLIRSTAKGRKVLVESEDVAEIGQHVTDYVVSQMAVRQRQRNGFAKHLLSTPNSDRHRRRSPGLLFWAFAIGLLTGGCGLFVLGYLLSQ